MPSGSQIIVFPDPVLRKKTHRVSSFDSKLSALVKRMILVMKNQESGIGIAAPQIGVNQAVAVIDVSPRIPSAGLKIMVNPVILGSSKEKTNSREGCMSIPHYTGWLQRHETVTVRWQDETGRFLTETFEGIEAVCVQHEIDHLNGVLFIDRVSLMKRDLIPRPKKFK